METGDLAITDSDLVTCGIQELGIRKVKIKDLERYFGLIRYPRSSESR